MTIADKVRALPAGMGHAEASRLLGCSYYTVRSVRRYDANPQKQRKRAQKYYQRTATHGGFGKGNAPVDEIKRRRDLGHSFRKIAKDMGVGLGAVSSTVRRYL